MKSYSQDKQDVLIFEKYLKNRENGYFVDIGANDGKTFSNSLLYEEMGWNGVCVEPHPRAFSVLSEIRKCICVNACISNETKKVNFLQVDGSPEMLSGILEFYDKRHLARVDLEIQRDGGSKKIVEIDSYTYKDLVEKYEIPNHVDYLSIDVEGGEMGVLKGIDFNSYSFGVIGIENNFGETYVIDYMKGFGYQKVDKFGADDIFIKI
jgi:FkbM family methyltransferase